MKIKFAAASFEVVDGVVSAERNTVGVIWYHLSLLGYYDFKRTLSSYTLYYFDYVENAFSVYDEIKSMICSGVEEISIYDFLDRLGLYENIYGDNDLLVPEQAPASGEASGSDAAGSDAAGPEVAGSDAVGSDAEDPDRCIECAVDYVSPDILLESYFARDLCVLNIFFDEDKRLPFMNLSDWHYFFVYEDGLCIQVDNTEFVKCIPSSADLFDACNDFVCRQVVYDPEYSRVIGFRVRYLA